MVRELGELPEPICGNRGRRGEQQLSGWDHDIASLSKGGKLQNSEQSLRG